MPPADYAILQEAAEWFAVLHADDAGPADQQAWERWHASSSAHRAAWRRVEAVSAEFRQVPAQPAREALDAAGSREAQARRRAVVKGLLALCLTTGTGGAVLLRRDTRSWVVSLNAGEKTAVGVIRQLALADGSQLWLNTATALDLDYSPGLRRIALHGGEIYLATARDSQQPARPLVVDTVHGRLRARAASRWRPAMAARRASCRPAGKCALATASSASPSPPTRTGPPGSNTACSPSRCGSMISSRNCRATGAATWAARPRWRTCAWWAATRWPIRTASWRRWKRPCP
ncbi:DUF4880 domain-containing protein [Janthinobacterium sp.]|uniref:DUF4880 domain-containing protein n=1 Tax=Janthinobacterium sp. TaxID=1871054 RepID=UPI00258C22F6|nr:DUF4880 domain-containing protein [Janthinobacterium sp.]MCX7289850.1 DUF4880 domain-containing protein [Janthinobacterium sp.]